jgi:hypothetical protein
MLPSDRALPDTRHTRYELYIWRRVYSSAH